MPKTLQIGGSAPLLPALIRSPSTEGKALLDALDGEPEDFASVPKSRLLELRAAQYDDQDQEIGTLQALAAAYRELQTTARAAIREAVGPEPEPEAEADTQPRPMYTVSGHEVPAAYLRDTPW